jgi:hypothetical protein
LGKKQASQTEQEIESRVDQIDSVVDLQAVERLDEKPIAQDKADNEGKQGGSHAGELSHNKKCHEKSDQRQAILPEWVQEKSQQKGQSLAGGGQQVSQGPVP